MHQRIPVVIRMDQINITDKDGVQQLTHITNYFLLSDELNSKILTETVAV